MFSFTKVLRLGRRALTCLAACAGLAHAQGVSLREMVVTATRSPVPLSEVLADVTVIERDEIERSGAAGVADVLARVPGVAVVRNGGSASNTSVYLRGSDTRFTAVFVDGIRLDSQSTGGAAWNAIPLALVDRIEVVRGPAAAVYGSDAMGGVVQIFTRRAEQAWAPSIGFGVGSHGTWQTDVSVSGQQGSFDYALSAARESSDGFDVRPNVNTDKDGHESESLSARLGWKFLEGHRLEWRAMRSDTDAQYDAAAGRDDLTYLNVSAMGLTWKGRWSDRYQTELEYAKSRDRYATAPSVYATDTEVSNYFWRHDWRDGPHLFTADLERREDALLNKSTTPYQTVRSRDAVALGYGFNGQLHNWQLNVRHDEDSEFGGKDTGSVSYQYRLNPQWRWSAAAATAFRAPTLFHLFSSYGVPSLSPESSRNLETGLSYRQGKQALGMVLYRNRLEDLIVYESTRRGCANDSNFGINSKGVPFDNRGCYANVARAQLTGATLTFADQWGNVGLNGSVDWLRAEDLGTGNRLPRRAQRAASLAADWAWLSWKWVAEAEFESMRFDNAANTKRLGGYAKWSLSAHRALTPEWNLQWRIDNLGDKHFELAQGYAIAGRTYFVGVRWSPN